MNNLVFSVREVTFGRVCGTPVSGQSYRYAYDGIGNRQISWLES